MVLNDTIFRYCDASPFDVQVEKYTTSISFQSANNYSIYSTLGNSQVAYCDTVGIDSLLLVYQTAYTGPVVNEWYFVLLDYDLNVINFLQISVPMAWGMYNDLKNCIVVGERIYVLANVGSEPTTIFEYDFNFDLQCELPVGSYEPEFALVEINDFAYFRKKVLTNYKFYKIQNCDFTNGITPNNGSEIYIYPNPATDNLMIQRNTTDVAIIEVYDVIGNLIRTEQLTEAHYLFNVSDFRPGTYILRIKSGDEIVTKRIVKQ